MITLHQFPAAFGLPCISPFGLKLQVFCKLANIEYKEIQGDPRKAPKNKLPYAELDGEVISDSEMIIQRLLSANHCTVDDWLTEQQKAIAHAMCRMLEERYYWSIVYARWIDDDVWPRFQKGLFSTFLPPVVRSILPPVIRKQVRKDLYSQGLGRHTKEEIYAFADRDLHALNQWLEGKVYCAGDQLSSYDATVFSYTCNSLTIRLDTPIKALASKYSNIVAYNDRMAAEFL